MTLKVLETNSDGANDQLLFRMLSDECFENGAHGGLKKRGERSQSSHEPTRGGRQVAFIGIP
jgi:hypothetical protein